ncbi:MAG: diflavin flavoprotein [Synechococcales cyanobacterium]
MKTNPTPRDVQVFPIARHTTALRSRSWTRLRFEVEYGRQRGTTANSYLIQGDQLVLIDPPGESFTAIFIEALGSRFNLSDVAYVIIGHTNTNRLHTLNALRPHLNNQVKLVCSNPAAQTLAALQDDFPYALQVIRGEEVLDIGNGHQLQLIPTPLPRWPDHLCTYDAATKILYSDKLFAAHVCGDQVFDEGWSIYEADRRYYYDTVLASQPLDSALERLSVWDAQLYAPGHGPIVREGRADLTASYHQWNQRQKSLSLRVALIYASAYGNTTTIAEALATGIVEAGGAVERLNCEVQTPADIQTAVEKADGILIGSPTLGGHLPTQVQTALGIVLASANRSTPVGVFGSFGWSGEGVDLLESKLKEAGFSFGFEPIRVKFSPNEEILVQCQQTGLAFADLLKRSLKRRQSPSLRSREPSGRLDQALGRVISSTGILTVGTQAQLLTTLAQATFNPPGFTFALPKSSPLEPLLYLGDAFVLNIMPEGSALLRQFQKQTLQDLAGIPNDTTASGGHVLTQALAYLEATVHSRMDAGEQWLLYAISTSGKVLQPNQRPALPQRRSG